MYAIEMQIEPGAEALLRQMGRQMRLKARSQILNRAIDHIRTNTHISEITGWFSEPRLAPMRRTTIRLSKENAQWLAVIADLVGRGRPALLLDFVYLAASLLQKEDFELICLKAQTA